MKKKKVVIIGAGTAGITCAYQLNRSKYDVEILESRNRIGGRIHTFTSRDINYDINDNKNEKSNDVNVDLGAAYIHGTINNPVYDVAQLFDMKKSKITAKRAARSPTIQPGRIYYDCDGKFIDHKDKSGDYFKIHNQYLQITNQLQKDYSNSFGNKKQEEEEEEKDQEEDEKYRKLDVDIESAMKEVIIKLNLPNLEPGTRQQRIFEYLRWQQEHWEGGDLNKTSLRNWIAGEFNFLRGGNVVLKNGYVSFLNELVQTAKLQITFNSIVQTIHWDQQSQSCIITLESGQTISCDYVVITVSIGVLQQSVKQQQQQSNLNSSCKLGIRFEPELPDWKVRSINNLTMGLLDKVMMRFKHSRNIPDFVSHWAHIGDERGKWPWWYVLDLDSKVIVAWTGTRYAWEAEQRTNEEIQTEVLEILSKIEETNIKDKLIDQKEILPNLKDDLVEFEFTRWGNDPFSLGSYSHLPP
eukprot:TRINITY_DN6786_c0_g1_i1.p1 TRINITY_DN6786_c0_g1~~TRINITY_DN6786_c0_g1_i1.p1  ORF type:complete len:468 (-),score=114.82 TRINITY_DN6786_c0_g1_i1:103-1506(-)